MQANSPATFMLAADIVKKKNDELIRFAKERLGDKAPSDVDSMERAALIELVRGIVKNEGLEKQEAGRAKPDSATAPGGNEKEVADKISNEAEAVHALRVMGFSSVEQVKAYLKGVEREKEQQKARIATIDAAQIGLDEREAKLKKREQDIDAKGKRVLEDLLELRQVRDNNAELVRQREALAKM